VTAEVEILLIAIVTAVAAALPGAFLVLRRMAMVSDAISHAILPGIVVAFFLVGDLSSPLLVVAAAATGLLTVLIIEALQRTGLVGGDAAIGLTFPALFSIGVILISRHASDIHLDTDSVLLGELAFAPFDRLLVAGHDLGPSALWTMGAILLLNLVFVAALFKELKLATVDSSLAALLGFSPALIHYALMTVVSITAVGAFNAVGSILVVALMIAPPATAYLVAERLEVMLWLSAGAAALSAAVGFAIAFVLDVSIAGSMATTAGVIFALALALAPRRGLLAQLRRRTRQRLDFGIRMLLVHLLHHADSRDALVECRSDTIHTHLQWPLVHTRTVVRAARERGLITSRDGILEVTTSGRELAQRAVVAAG
jgi:manganese/zinc/iron transport system permease protein